MGADTLFVSDTGHLEIQRAGKDLYNSGDELGLSFWLKHKGKIVDVLYDQRLISHYIINKV